MKKGIIVTLLLACSIMACLATVKNISGSRITTHLVLGCKKSPQYIPPNGFVPDKETAIKIAEAIWFPVYREIINNEKPFNATLLNGVWVVKGTFNGHGFGGVAYIEIQKSDCKILKVIHGK